MMRPYSLGLHLLDHSADSVEGAVQVHVDDRVPVLDAHLVHHGRTGEPGKRGEDIDAAVGLHRRCRQRLHGIPVAHVGGNHEGFATRCFDGRLRLFQRLAAPRGQGHLGALLPVPHRDRAADTLARSGHDGHSTRQATRHRHRSDRSCLTHHASLSPLFSPPRLGRGRSTSILVDAASTQPRPAAPAKLLGEGVEFRFDPRLPGCGSRSPHAALIEGHLDDTTLGCARRDAGTSVCRHA